MHINRKVEKDIQRNMKADKRKIILIIFTITLIMTLTFIWVHSMMPREESANESSTVKEVIEEVISSVTHTEVNIPEFLIRKLAHIIEYSALGLQIPILAVFSYKKKEEVLKFFSVYKRIVLLPLPVAVIDETIQLFSERGSQISDVWIDFVSASFALIISLIIARIIRKKMNI